VLKDTYLKIKALCFWENNMFKYRTVAIAFVVSVLCVLSSLVLPTLLSAQTTLRGEYLIESALKSGMYLDVKDARAEDYSLIQLAGPGDQPNRRWRFIPVQPNLYMIETVLKRGFVLDVKGANSDDYTVIQLGGNGVQQNRLWRLIPVGNGEYMIETALKRNVFLDVRDARAENYMPIQLGGNNDGGRDQPNRRWRLIRVDFN
jgi:Ricin-type beta-trefoil lectin domain-like